jgi:transposase
MRITFLPKTVNQLRMHLQQAYELGNLKGVRRISVLLMVSEQEAMEKIIAVWDVSRQTIIHWVKSLMWKGFDSLQYEKPKGRPAKLTKTQKDQLRVLIKQGPEACGYDSGCWTSILIQELIRTRFGVLFNRFYVCELLRNLGFSRQKARFVSDHLSEEKRKNWMEVEWPKILEQAKLLGASLFFGDEASFALWGSLSYTWAPRGEQPEIKTSGKRKGYKMFGLIEFFTGKLVYKGIEAKFNSDSYADFLKKLLDQVSGTIFLVQDGARYHTSKAMQAFFQEHQERLKIFQLPSYSPDYNPIEYLWKKVKSTATHNRYFEDFAKLTASVDKALATLATQANEILNLMGVYTKSLATGEPL